MKRFITYIIIFIALGAAYKFFKPGIQKVLLKTDISVQGMATDYDFLRFVREGDLDSVQYYLKAGMSADTSYLNEPALMVAIYENHFEVAQALLDAGANPNIADTNGKSPLMITAANRDYPDQSFELAQKLLHKGADKSSVDSNGQAAVDYAWQASNTKVASLLEGSSSSESSDYSPSSYFEAQDLLSEIARTKSQEKFKELIRLGPDGVRVVVEGLSDSDPGIQGMSRTLLPKMGKIPSEYRDQIQEQYEDKTNSYRQQFAQALINTADTPEEKIEILEEMVQDSNYQIVHDALKKLKAMGNKARPVIPTLRRLMDEQPQMRRPLQNAINKIDQ